MVRTKADNSSKKAVSAKAPRKIVAASGGSGAGTSNGASEKSGKAAIGGGNPVCVRPIPDWQKGIAGFMVKSANGDSLRLDSEDIDLDAGPSSAMPKHAAAEQNGHSESEHGDAAASEIPNGNGHVSDDDEQEEETAPVSKKKKAPRKQANKDSSSDEREAGASGVKRASQKSQKQPARKRKSAAAAAKESKKNGVISDSDSD